MNLKRIGATVFALGLLGFALGTVFGVGTCAIASCADAGRTFAVTGFDWSNAALQYSDGCSECSSPFLGGSLLAVLVGVLVSAGGVGRDVLGDE